MINEASFHLSSTFWIQYQYPYWSMIPFLKYSFKNICLFIWPCQVLVVPCGIFNCGVWNLVPFCHSLLLLPSNFLSIRVFSNESALPIMWPKYWNFSFCISSSNEYSMNNGLAALRPALQPSQHGCPLRALCPAGDFSSQKQMSQLPWGRD